MRIEENKPLAPLTTLGVGGPARYFCEVSTEDELAEAANWARERDLPTLVLGGGSNVVISDASFNGLVLHNALSGITSASGGGTDAVYLHAGAGHNWDRFVSEAVHLNYAGVECLAGIPGTVGGTPVQNVGAYGQEVSSVIESVRAYDLQQQTFVEFLAAECGFSYRRSRFNSADKGRFIVTRVDFRLLRNGAPTLKYAELHRSFAPGARPSLVEVAEAVRRIRQSKGMLLVDGDADCCSAGSFFKNPVVALGQLETIAEVAGKEPPQFLADAGYVKIPAAWLIEQAGFNKGYMRGAAGISSRHTLALVNLGGATAADILGLADEICAGVQTKFGIQLEMEPVLVNL